MDDSMISKLSFLGAALTLFVISLGAWVRLTDAGLDVQIGQAALVF